MAQEIFSLYLHHGTAGYGYKELHVPALARGRLFADIMAKKRNTYNL